MMVRLLANALIFMMICLGLAFSLVNIQIKGRPIWCYLNHNLVIPGGQSYRMLRELDEIGTTDWLLVGSSHAYRGYDPFIFEAKGVRLFNAGSSSQSLGSSMTLLEYYKNKYQGVILDIYGGSLTERSPEEQLTLLQNTPDAGLAARILESKLDVFSLNNMLYRILRLDESPKYNDEDYVGKGYSRSRQKLQSEVAVPAYAFEVRQEQILRKIIRFCKDHHKEIVLVSHPLPKPSGTVPDYLLFRQKVESICNEYRVPFFDYTYQHQLDNSYFMDHNHLNEKGVRYFDLRLIGDHFNRLQ